MKRQRIRLTLKSYDHQLLDKAVREIAMTAKKTGTALVGPVPLPNKHRCFTVLRSTFVNPDAASASSGFNNASLFMKHQLYVKNDTGKTFRISGLLRQTFPIGPKSVGSNTYQTYVGFIAGDISIKRGFYTNLGYNIVSDGNGTKGSNKIEVYVIAAAYNSSLRNEL